jgi:signal recognition particle subunit SRP54
MFDFIQKKLLSTIRSAGGRGRLSAGDLEQVVVALKTTLLESDVHPQVAQNFCDGLEAQLSREEIYKSLTPEQTILKGARDQLIYLLGKTPPELNLQGDSRDPDVIVLVGLYGVGKTTHAGKLALWLKSHLQKTPFLVSCDASRPAAHEQMMVLAQEAGVSCMPLPEKPQFNPIKRAKSALGLARRDQADVVIVDTSGRNSLDASLLEDIRLMTKKIAPQHIWLVLDAMLGQSSIQVAQAFHEACKLTGNVITKCDSDARGGVALSASVVTGQPIYFLGVGEHPKDLEPFVPAKMAARILDLGDLEGLLNHVDSREPEMSQAELLEALERGHFTLHHFLAQLTMLKSMGPLMGLMKMIPGMGQMLGNTSQGQLEQMEENLKKFRAIMSSMTPEERQYPAKLNGSRKKRIASGSGTEPQDVNQLLKQFEQMKKMMGMFRQGRMPFGKGFPFPR